MIYQEANKMLAKKEQYTRLYMEIIRFDSDDIIYTSPTEQEEQDIPEEE